MDLAIFGRVCASEPLAESRRKGRLDGLECSLSEGWSPEGGSSSERPGEAAVAHLSALVRGQLSLNGTKTDLFSILEVVPEAIMSGDGVRVDGEL